ncbi:endonuclease/exonuclease/phosphatase family protein [Pedobacter endophyticus]|uniref:Endonuclease/exonuclease/phosphatase family protein n=1 Tax=Pedobacter endophyticus TaxID=2789740 RepID=A0A7U3SPY7_9SPHI|nr:endonuclease/exonuclease/phosphatase family protein [Pedobacter endophyticus]QPH38556.1 endonuclease/exonuclease/phosphatase family protein [Pedobacter endophyticus]
MNLNKIFSTFLLSIVLLGSMGCGKGTDPFTEKPVIADPCKSGNCLTVATLNVGVGQRASATVIAQKLKPLNLDVLTLTECPTLIDQNSMNKDFVALVAETLDMPYWKLGTISSANHWKDWGTDISGKYHGKLKAVLSKTPLSNPEDIALQGSGFSPSSVVKVNTVIKNKPFAIYALHVPGSSNAEGSVHKYFADQVLSKETSPNILVMGDFNNVPSGATMLYLKGKGLKDALDDLTNLSSRIDPYKPGRIDHILYNGASEIKAVDGYSKFDANISDHPYIWVKMLYK